MPNRINHPLISTTKPCDSKALNQALNQLQQLYPFVKVQTIGSSVLGKELREIRIGNGQKKIHMNASFHANEWITTVVLMNLVNNYLYSLTNGMILRGLNPVEIYENIDLSIVPMVNPDGVDLVLNGPPHSLRTELMSMNEGSDDFVHWKANIRGVDLNKQYPAKWELLKNSRDYPTAPGPRDFPGISPLTEPEAIVMADLARENLFDCVVAFHTQGQEFYWGYEGFEPSISENMAKEFERISGYKAVRYVASHAGYKDWYIQEFKRPGFTLELGKGINPLPLSQYPEIEASVEGIFLAALYFTYQL